MAARRLAVVSLSAAFAASAWAAADPAPAPATYVLCGRPACMLVDRDGRAVVPRVFDRNAPPDEATGQRTPSSPVAPAPARAAVEILTTAEGQVLGDGKGRALSRPYTRIYPPLDADEQSMLAVGGEPAAPTYAQLFRDGRALPFPDGASIDRFRDGVATLSLRSAPGGPPRNGQGLVDMRGAVVIAPTFDEVRPARDGLVAIRQGQRWGIADVGGRIRVAPTYTRIDFQSRGGRFAVVTAEGRAGVVDGDGRPIVPARYDAIDWVDDGLLAATMKAAATDARGQPEPRAQLFDRDGRAVPAPPMRYPPTVASFGLLCAYDIDGRETLLDRQGRLVATGVDGCDAFRLPDTAEGPFFVRRGQQYAVVAAGDRELSSRRFYTVYQPYRQGRAVADDSLLDETGRVVATYASVAPPGTAWPDDFDEQFEALVDPCFDAEPARPGELPEPLRSLCADPVLRAQLREAEDRYLRSTTSLALLVPEIARHARFQKELLACGDASCRSGALQRRLATLPVPAAAPVVPADLRLRVLRARVPSALQRRLLAESGTDVDVGGAPDWSFVDLRGDGSRQVMAWSREGMHNNGFALWAQAGERWRLLLADSGNGVQAIPRGSGRWPDIVVSQHGSAAESELLVFRGDAGRYRPLASCSMRWAGQSEPYLVCDGDAPWPARRRSPQP